MFKFLKAVGHSKYECEKYRLKYQWAQHRLDQYDHLFSQLKKFERLRLTESGGIVAYKKVEAEETKCGKWTIQNGTMFMVPHEMIRLEIT